MRVANSWGRISSLLYRARFWEQEYSLTALLVMLVVTLFVVTPLASSAAISSEIMLCFLAALTITGVAVVSARRSVVMVVMVLAAAGIALDWAAHFEDRSWLRGLDYLVRLAFVLSLASIVTVQVFRRGNVTHHRVQGAICVYLLAGLAWAYSFDLLLILDRSAFRVAGVYDSMAARRGMFRYFSFATLTTLGDGDIQALSPMARSLAILEALFGQLYPAVMIARIVSLEVVGRRRAEPVAPSQPPAPSIEHIAAGIYNQQRAQNLDGKDTRAPDVDERVGVEHQEAQHGGYAAGRDHRHPRR
jgi:Ion channel